MAEYLDLNPADSEDIHLDATETDAQELAIVIAEFEQYRERLVQDTMATAQRAKLPQKAAMTQIEPELARIDAALQNLRDQQATLASHN